jgi:DNA repair photolyase
MRLPLTGRGSQINPPNRFTQIDFEDDPEYQDDDESTVRTQYFADDSKSIVSENDSPDVPFRYSVNPYRGCQHGCSYCFARPTHEYLDLSAGLDFETKIFVKRNAPALFRDWLARCNYQPEFIAISGVTDCYQPIEKKLCITRQLLEIALEARQPVGIITKNALVTRDLDLLKEMAASNIVRVNVSVTTLDQSLTKVMEPRTSSPAARLRAIEELSDAGVRVGVLVAPIIPALTDHEIPTILKAVKEAGAASAGHVILRLPWSVKPVFLEWLDRTQPDKKAKIESRIRAIRGGKLYESEFGTRMSGTGEFAEQIHRTFALFAKKFGLDAPSVPMDTSQFRRPTPRSGQQWLFA